jgi:hypothetical protein
MWVVVSDFFCRLCVVPPCEISFRITAKGLEGPRTSPMKVLTTAVVSNRAHFMHMSILVVFSIIALWFLGT